MISTLEQLYRNPHWWEAAGKMRGWSECLFQHSILVADLALALGRESGMPERELEVLQAAGFLHDLGKVSWPRHLAVKTSLDEADWRIIRIHPLVGAELAVEMKCSDDETVLRIIREHHEHGPNGYPLEHIDLHPLSKVIVVAEMYAAMTEARPYRSRPLTPRNALETLSQNGHDLRIVAALKNVLRKDRQNAPDFN